MIDLEILHVIIISINYCLQIALPEAGAFNDPVLKYLTGKMAKYHSYFYLLLLWLWKHKNIFSWGCHKIGFFSTSLHRTLSDSWRLEEKKVLLKAGIFEIGTNKEGIWKKLHLYFFLNKCVLNTTF